MEIDICQVSWNQLKVYMFAGAQKTSFSLRRTLRVCWTTVKENHNIRSDVHFQNIRFKHISVCAAKALWLMNVQVSHCDLCLLVVFESEINYCSRRATQRWQSKESSQIKTIRKIESTPYVLWLLLHIWWIFHSR